jgi:anti-sigma factor RsiW
MADKRETNWEFQISQYLDGLLADQALSEFRARLQSDPQLRESLREYQALQEQIDALGREDLAIDFDAQRAEIMAQIRRRPRRGSWRPRLARPVVAALAIAAVVVLAWGVVTIARWVLPGPLARVESVAIRPAAIQPGQVVATVVPAGPGHDVKVKGLVSVLARRQQAPYINPVGQESLGTVVVSVGSPEQVNGNKTKEPQAPSTNDMETYWF